MYDMSVSIQHDVPVVSVLDLQQEAHHAVRRHRRHEAATRRLGL